MRRKLKAKIFEVDGHQWKFAHRVGVHEAYVSHIINRRRELSPQKQAQWAKALGVKPEEIFS